MFGVGVLTVYGSVVDAWATCSLYACCWIPAHPLPAETVHTWELYNKDKRCELMAIHSRCLRSIYHPLIKTRIIIQWIMTASFQKKPSCLHTQFYEVLFLSTCEKCALLTSLLQQQDMLEQRGMATVAIRGGGGFRVMGCPGGKARWQGRCADELPC